ncbi:hypothetical protein ACU6YF_11475 [Klebsiella aerogenes]|uniref:hypothetical protein n=1 Tax=Klebsiella aerogenes TaxID=548 RepID=UPI0029309AB5|nr:hypothetical protein [Klebsiella aerogenes]
MAEDKIIKKEDIEQGIGTEFIVAYYRERYDEAKANYRRLEDKVNFLLAVIGVEASAILAIFGSLNISPSSIGEIFLKLALLFLCACILSLVMCFYYLWHSWGLRAIPYMPTHKTREQHDYLLTGQIELVLKYHMIKYGEAVSRIEELHKKKAIYVNNLFDFVALSFGFFILSVTFLMINKV